MIKILFFVDTTLASGGAEKVLRTLVNNMDQSKFDITVQTAWPENAEKYLAPDIRYKSLYKKKNRITKFLYRIETMLGLTYRLRMKDDYDIEVAYLENGPTKVLASSTNKNAIKIAWVHCDLCQMVDDPASLSKKAKKWYSKYNKVVCVAESVKESYVSLFGNIPEAVVLHNTVDSNDIIMKGTEPLPWNVRKRKCTFATVGRFYHPKGYDRLLRVHKRLIDEGFDYDLWILGDGPGRTELERFIQENDLEGSVCLHGFQKNPYSFMTNADIVVCSSRYEGFSTVVAEALILGKPVVTTNCSGMYELLGDSEYGMIIENSEQGLYEGMKKMLRDPQLLSYYQAQAQHRGQSFHMRSLVGRTEEFFADELGEIRSQ